MHLLLLGAVLVLSFVAHTPSVGALLLYAITFGLTLGGSDVSWVALVRYRFPELSVARTYSAWYFVEIATLGLAVALEQLIFLNAQFTGGTTGTVVGSPRVFGEPAPGTAGSRQIALAPPRSATCATTSRRKSTTDA